MHRAAFQVYFLVEEEEKCSQCLPLKPYRLREIMYYHRSTAKPLWVPKRWGTNDIKQMKSKSTAEHCGTLFSLHKTWCMLELQQIHFPHHLVSFQGKAACIFVAVKQFPKSGKTVSVKKKKWLQ